MPLTDTKIRRMPPPERDRLIPFGGRLGLYLRVRAATGRKSWVIRRREAGAWRVETIGEWPGMSARDAEARAAGNEAAPAAGVTFRDAIPDFRREVIEPHYTAAPREIEAYLTRDCKRLLPKRLDRIGTPDIDAAVRAKADTPNAAGKQLAVLKQFFAWAVQTGRARENPTIGLSAKKVGLRKYVPRERVLSADEIRAIWALPEEPYGRLLRFTLLTACRIGESRALAPDQIVGSTWTIPMTKNGRPHVVPLSPSAAALAAAGWPHRSYGGLHTYLGRRGHNVPWNVHDLRRTAATLMADAGVPVDAIEAVLNHLPPKMVRTYQRPDTMPAKRAALARLEATVLAIVAPPTNAGVAS